MASIGGQPGWACAGTAVPRGQQWSRGGRRHHLKGAVRPRTPVSPGWAVARVRVSPSQCIAIMVPPKVLCVEGAGSRVCPGLFWDIPGNERQTVGSSCLPVVGAGGGLLDREGAYFASIVAAPTPWTGSRGFFGQVGPGTVAIKGKAGACGKAACVSLGLLGVEKLGGTWRRCEGLTAVLQVVPGPRQRPIAVQCSGVSTVQVTGSGSA